MTTALATRSSRGEQRPAIFKLAENDAFFQRLGEVYDAIARRAYDLFEIRGRQDGHDWEDWFQAEFEALNPMPVEIRDADNELIVHADLPGFTDKDIEVRVEPQRLIISGKREEVHDERKQKTLYSERRSNEVLRTLDLPEPIDPDKVKATLHDGTLEIALPKAQPAKKVPVSTKAA